MKIRNGFISNSSSSSFVIITTKEKWGEAKEKLAKKFKNYKLSEYLADILINSYGKGKKCKVLGQNALIFREDEYDEDYGADKVSELERDNKITSEDLDKLMDDVYNNTGELTDILKEDGVSYVLR